MRVFILYLLINNCHFRVLGIGCAAKCLFVCQNYPASIFWALVVQPNVCLFARIILLASLYASLLYYNSGAFYNEFNTLFCKDYFFVYPDMGLVICGDHWSARLVLLFAQSALCFTYRMFILYLLINNYHFRVCNVVIVAWTYHMLYHVIAQSKITGVSASMAL